MTLNLFKSNIQRRFWFGIRSFSETPTWSTEPPVPSRLANSNQNSNLILRPPSTPQSLHHHLASILARHGQRGDRIVAQVHHQLTLRYHHPNPIMIAIDAVKPVMRYYKSKANKAYIPITLFPHTAESMALRWLVQSARERTYLGGRPDIVRGLIDELDAIIQGTSTLYRKRFDTHRNPN